MSSSSQCHFSLTPSGSRPFYPGRHHRSTAAWRPVQFLRKRLSWQWLWSGESPYYSNETIYHPLSVETEGCFRPNLANEMYFFSRPVITLCRLLLQWWAGVKLISNNRLIPATVARNRSPYVWKLLIRLFVVSSRRLTMFHTSQASLATRRVEMTLRTAETWTASINDHGRVLINEPVWKRWPSGPKPQRDTERELCWEGDG